MRADHQARLGRRIPRRGASPRSTILLAWELGAGMGHAQRLLTIARALKERGWLPVVAARELWACMTDYQAAQVPVLQAPHHRGQIAPGTAFRARGYADIMAACGFVNVAALEAPVAGWTALLDLVKPRAVVADYCPLLSLAAFGRVPLIAVGDGFVLPPPERETMPIVREGSGMPGEAVLLENAATFQRRHGRPVPPNLPALIGGQAHVVCTFPETDVYAPIRSHPALGPVSVPPRALPRSRHAVFAYLAADFAGTRKLLQALLNTGLPLEAFIRDAPDDLKAGLRRAGVHVHDHPPPLEAALIGASVIVHHGGIGTAEAALALGRSQVLLPRHLEQTMNAAALERVGVATRIPSSFTLAEAATRVREAALSPALEQRALDVAESIRQRAPWPSLERIAEACAAYR